MHIETEDFISLTDIAKHKDPDRTDYIIQIYYVKETQLNYLIKSRTFQKKVLPVCPVFLRKN